MVKKKQEEVRINQLLVNGTLMNRSNKRQIQLKMSNLLVKLTYTHAINSVFIFTMEIVRDRYNVSGRKEQY